MLNKCLKFDWSDINTLWEYFKHHKTFKWAVLEADANADADADEKVTGIALSFIKKVELKRS